MKTWIVAIGLVLISGPAMAEKVSVQGLKAAVLLNAMEEAGIESDSAAGHVTVEAKRITCAGRNEEAVGDRVYRCEVQLARGEKLKVDQLYPAQALNQALLAAGAESDAGGGHTILAVKRVKAERRIDAAGNEVFSAVLEIE